MFEYIYDNLIHVNPENLTSIILVIDFTSLCFLAEWDLGVFV